MATLNDAKTMADRILVRLLKNETEGLTDALDCGDYPKARRWAKQLEGTLKSINKELEARK